MLWAITSYFNPARYRSRPTNYRTFRAHLKVPLVTVEASHDGRFELQTGDADILVQLHARAVLWQKERLLNVALGFLPSDCREVAWLDCDVVFASDDWPTQASAALRTHSLVQLYSERCELDRQATADPSRRRDGSSIVQSVGSRIAAGRATPEDLSDPEAPLVRGTTAGLAWAASRAALDVNGLYDACVLGTGDRVILCSAMGELDFGAQAIHMNARQKEHYRRWAEPFAVRMARRVGAIEGRIFHLWHGDLGERRYGERHRALRRFRFDPFVDIAVDDEGCWCWNAPKRAMHEYVRGYFTSRREDGPEPGSAP